MKIMKSGVRSRESEEKRLRPTSILTSDSLLLTPAIKRSPAGSSALEGCARRCLKVVSFAFARAASLGRADRLRALLLFGRGSGLRAFGLRRAGRAAHGSARPRLLVVADAVGLLAGRREPDVAGT